MAKNLFTIALCVIIILSAILIGSPLNSNIEAVNIIISILTICYSVWNCKKNKENVYGNYRNISRNTCVQYYKFYNNFYEQIMKVGR